MFDIIIKVFKELGQPAAKWSAEDKAAFELGVARKLSTAADARKNAAKKAAQKAGIIADIHRIPGEEVVWIGKVFRIIAKTAAPRSYISGDALTTELLKHVPATTAAQIVAASTVEAKAATSFEVEPV